MIRLKPRHVRTRLTLWYVGVLSAVLGVFVVGTSGFLFLNLRSELDRNTIQDLETMEGLLNFAPDGTVRLSTDDHDDHEEEYARFMEVRSPDGALLYRNKNLAGNALGGAQEPGEGEGSYSERSARLPDGTRIRLVSRSHTIGDRRVLIRLAHSEEPLWRELTDLVWVLLVGFPVALAFAGFGGYGLARRALAPLGAMARQAQQVTAERLSERLPVDNPEDELGQLARVFNETLARLERSFDQLRRFTSDASHELRTPLTAIRTVGEVALQKGGDVAYHRDIIGSMLEEATRLTRLVDSLLMISRADAGQVQLHLTNFALLDLARESAALLNVLAEEKSQDVVVEGEEGITVCADRLILRQALVNLIDNAVRYSPVSGTIRVRIAKSAAGEAIVEVRDSCSGIELEHQARVFDRFYRIGRDRSRDSGGAGLGLSIAKWAVEANAGRIDVESQPDKGCTFRIRFPLAAIGSL